MLSKYICRPAASMRRNPFVLNGMPYRAFASMKEYDLAVVGGGPGGYVAAIKGG